MRMSSPRPRLRLEAARTVPGPLPLRAFTDAIDEAFATEGFVSYREAYAYAEGIDAVIAPLRDLLRDGTPWRSSPHEHALQEAEEAVGSVDDSDGHLGEIAASSSLSTSRPAPRPIPTPSSLRPPVRRGAAQR